MASSSAATADDISALQKYIGSAVESARSFLIENSCIESSKLINNVCEELQTSKNKYDFFIKPIKSRLLGYEKSLVWMHFVHSNMFLNEIQNTGDDEICAADKNSWDSINLHDCLKFIALVHDLAFDKHITMFTMIDDDEEEFEEEFDGESDEDSS